MPYTLPPDRVPTYGTTYPAPGDIDLLKAAVADLDLRVGYNAASSTRRSTGWETFPVDRTGINTIGGTSGTSKFAAFVPLVPFAMNQIEIWCGNVAAVTASKIVYALHTVNGAGNLTRIGVTANDTTLMAATNTAYPKALTSSAGTAVVGQRYVVEFFCSAATMPQLYGVAVLSGAAVAAAQGRTNRAFFNGPASQTDSQTSYLGTDLQTTGNFFYAWVGP
jgi:hypothetical protein